LDESEGERVRHDFWEVVGSGQVGLVLLVVGVLGAAAATWMAQANDLDKLATAEWAVGIGLGMPFAICGVILFGVWRRTLRQQREDARTEARKARAEVAEQATHIDAEAQFAAALRAAELLPNAGLEALSLEWFRATKVLVADVFGELEGVKFDAPGGLEVRRERLDVLAGRLGDGTLREPSKRWTERAKLIGKFNDLLWEMNKEGNRLKDELLAKEPGVGRSDVDAWLNELQEVLHLMPDFFRHTFNSDPIAAMMIAEYEGIDDPAINLAITLLDRRLPYISSVLYPLRNYVQAISGT
jgi:hypothetical protein